MITHTITHFLHEALKQLYWFAQDNPCFSNWSMKTKFLVNLKNAKHFAYDIRTFHALVYLYIQSNAHTAKYNESIKNIDI